MNVLLGGDGGGGGVCVCVYYPFAVGAFINIVLLALEGFCWGVWLGVIGSANCRIILMTQTTAP